MSVLDPAAIDALLKSCKHGDLASFEQVVVILARDVRLFIAARCPVIDLIEETVQAAFVTAYEHLSEYELRGTFASWVKGIAYNHLREECVHYAIYAISSGSSSGVGPAAYWKFDGTSGTTAIDSSGNANTGTLVNDPIWSVGKLGGALSFNGATTYISAAPSTSINNLGPMPVTAWIKPNNLGAFNLGRIVAKENTRLGRWMLIFTGTNALTFVKDFATTELRRATSANAITLGTWQHVAVTWDGGAAAGNVHIYVNGVEKTYAFNQSGVGSKTSDATTKLMIGNRAALDRGFNGLIDDVRLYNRMLSATEITGLVVPTSSG